MVSRRSTVARATALRDAPAATTPRGVVGRGRGEVHERGGARVVEADRVHVGIDAGSGVAIETATGRLLTSAGWDDVFLTAGAP